MKFSLLTATVCILTDSALAQLPVAPRYLKGAADSEFGAGSPMSFSMSTSNESFIIANGSSGGRGGGSKSRKSGKAGKKGKKRDKSLIATLAPIDGYMGNGNPSGTVSLNFNLDGSFLLSVDAAGFDVFPLDGFGGAANGFALITSGTSCNDLKDIESYDDLLRASYYDKSDSSVSNPWGDERRPAIEYTRNEEVSNSAWRIDNGFGSQENDGHAFWLFDYALEGGWAGYDNKHVACGVLGVASDRMFLVADMGVYPDYQGSLVVTGKVRVIYRKDGTFKLKYNLKGLEADCEVCGIHIDAGTSCDSAAGLMGDMVNDEVVENLWTADGGAAYNSDAEGNAEGYFNMYNGYSFGKNVGHAVVVRAQNGERLACGVLEGVVHESEMENL